VGTAGVIAAGAGFIAMWRNVTPALGTVADVNNYLLPVWMIVMGWALVKHQSRSDAPALLRRLRRLAMTRGSDQRHRHAPSVSRDVNKAAQAIAPPHSLLVCSGTSRWSGA
jgi:hypothetical protein